MKPRSTIIGTKLAMVPTVTSPSRKKATDMNRKARVRTMARTRPRVIAWRSGVGAPAPPRVATRMAGAVTRKVSTPSTRNAWRQPKRWISAWSSGGVRAAPTPTPTSASPSAEPRRRSNRRTITDEKPKGDRDPATNGIRAKIR